MSCSIVSKVSSLAPPAANQVELVLIGPRYGESMCLHIGDNRWVVVDSCVYGPSKVPAPLYYLDQIGVSPLAIERVAATHWHDDHVRGLSAVVDAAQNAKFCMPNALSTREFATLAAAYSSTPMTKGVTELHTILKEIDVGRIQMCGPSQLILRDTTSAGAVEIWSLSPSTDELRASLVEFSALIPKEGEPLNQSPSRSPNHLAMVLFVKVGDVSMVLGADLEEHGDPNRGWSAVLTQMATESGSSLFKIPHHGSATAYHSGVWSNMLSSNPVAVITPFHHGRSKLPTDEEVRRIKGHTEHVFLTTPQPLVRSKGKPQIVEDEIAAVTKGRGMHHEQVSPGVIRCRVDLASNAGTWDVGLIGAAVQL